MSEMSVITVELPDDIVIVSIDADSIVEAMAGLDWGQPNDREAYMESVTWRFQTTGITLLFFDSFSFLQACHEAEILKMTMGVTE